MADFQAILISDDEAADRRPNSPLSSGCSYPFGRSYSSLAFSCPRAFSALDQDLRYFHNWFHPANSVNVQGFGLWSGQAVTEMQASK